ncbi:MAG: DHA2 family efflux MFS transporter permease subunit [Candidatus Tectomicrobia bacterium]|nr:DHA2 family efflux MFS transporter permease subunit [Candidatus Tectomicrobia bacterium]
MESSASESSYLSLRDRWLTTGLVGIGLVVFAITSSTTNLILPKMMTSLRVEFYYIHWVITAFSIARTVTIPALGWLSGRFGPRTLYLVSQALFTIGLLGSALAWDWSSLLFFRILTGASGGLINPLSMAIFYQIFPPDQRGMALGLSLMGWSIGPAVGPIMGGYLLEFASWRIVYLVMIPFSSLGVLLAWWLLPVLNRPERRRLDQYGLLTIGIAVTTFIIALSQGRRVGWDSQSIVVLFAISALAAILFVIIELRHPEPLVELRLLTTPPFLMAVLVVCLTTMTFRTTEPMLPVLMQRLLGFEPLKVAWTMMPSQIVYGLAVLATGRLSDRIAPEFLVVGGLLLYAGSFIGFSGVTVWTTAWSVNAFLCLRFIAEGLITSPNNLTALRALSEQQVMMASGLIGLFRSIANALSMALSVVLWDQNYGRYLQLIAQSSPHDSVAFTSVLLHFQQTLNWMGEIALQVPTLSMALMGRVLHTEASTAAWSEYLIFNGMLALIAIVPALLVNSRWWQWVQRKSPDKREDVEAASLLRGSRSSGP